MKKGAGNKKLLWIILIIVIALILIGIILFFLLKQGTLSFGKGFDFSSGLDSIGKSGNAFENAKLNPFTNSTR